MSIVKAYDVAYVRFRAPDLGIMRSFLDDFGMLPAEPMPDRLFMRGYGTAPFLHATEPGEPGFLGFGIRLNSMDDLALIAAHDSAEIERLDAPGGGFVVRLVDPDGFGVEVVAGQEMVAPEPAPSPLPWNESGDQRRIASFRRIAKRASHVKRLGHVVLGVADFKRAEAWYKERFGFVTSDEIQPAPGHAIGAFMRCDRGAETCDHHTLFLMQRPIPPGYIHAAFEVVDMDDLMAGHDHLERGGHQAVWGVGRHLLGSQIFDYWTDPWGHEVEHWTDGDQLATKDGGRIASFDELVGVQWGMKMPPIPDAPVG